MDPITGPAALLATDVRSLSDAELRAHLLTIDRLVNAAIASRRSAVAEFDARNLAACDGAVNTGAWLRARCEMSRGESQNETRTARRLRELPEVRTAAGELGAAKVALFARAVDAVRRGDAALVEAPHRIEPARRCAA